MKKSILFVVITLLLAVNTSIAFGFNLNDQQIDNSQIEDFINEFNSMDNQNNAINTLRNTFNNEIIQINLEKNNQTYMIRIEDGNITEIKEGITNKSTIDIDIDESMLERFENITGINEAGPIILNILEDKEIEIKSTENTSIMTRMAIWTSDITIRIGSFFNNLF